MLLKKLVLMFVIVFFSTGLVFADYPRRPIELIIPFAAGGGSDLMSRIIANYLGEELGKPLVLRNVTGAQGQSGWDSFVQTKPDGYTIATLALPHAIAQPLARDTVYKTESFEPIALFRFEPVAIYVRNESPYKKFQDFLADAKKRPGKVVVAPSTLLGHTDTGLWQIKEFTGIQIKEVNFTSNSDMNLSLLGGHVDIGLGNTSVGYSLKDKVRILAVMHKTRIPFIPDVPTLMELGFSEDMGTMGVIDGIVALKGTSPEIIDRLNSAFENIFKNPLMLKKFDETGMMIDFHNRKKSIKILEEQKKIVKEMLQSRSLLKKVK